MVDFIREVSLVLLGATATRTDVELGIQYDIGGESVCAASVLILCWNWNSGGVKNASSKTKLILSIPLPKTWPSVN